MKIAMIAPFEESVPPKKYGGTELVVYNLVEELTKLGHEIVLFGVGNSKTSAKLITIFKNPLRSNINSKLLDLYKIVGVGKVLKSLQEEDFDIVHNHIGWRLLPFESFVKTNMVTTLHGPLTNTINRFAYEEYKTSSFISISKNQQSTFPELNFVGNVYNGIDLSKFKLFQKPKDYFAFLGRMSPEKGPYEAIKAAKKTGVNLVMAAKVDPVDQAFFNLKIKPLIDGKQIKFIGEIDHKGKLELLGNAKALVAPIQWNEPFGLYFIEAMACGTPVVTLDRGSVREIIKDHETGFICKDFKEFCLSLKKTERLKRSACFEYVNKTFSSKKMASKYEKVYQYLIDER